MNKTININLANALFHIDENAYHKLQRYLEAVKRSFENTPGEDEIIADIEARVSELFADKQEDSRQVITEKIVDEVITIMGQPEDYMVDEDIFDDAPQQAKRSKKKASKKLYRDVDNKFVAGVSSGLGHYMGIDSLWIRLAWVLLVLLGMGSPILLYFLLWILVPEAKTTSEKIAMTGEPVNISNIEKKVTEGLHDVTDKIKEGFEGVKEGFGTATDKVKNADYSGVKNSSKTFFDTIGDLILFLFKIFGKFIGILLIIIGASTIIGLFVGLISAGVADMFHLPGLDIVDLLNTTSTPVWLVSILAFFAVGIPFFFLFYLGLKILVTNLKSIGNIAKYSLLGLWIISVITLIVLGVKQAAEFAYTGTSSEKKELYINTADTLKISMKDSEYYENGNSYMHIGDVDVFIDDNGKKTLVFDDVRFNIKHSKDSTASIRVRKEARGNSYESASSRAKNSSYNYQLNDNHLVLNSFLTTDSKNKFRDQEVFSSVYIPTGTILKLDNSTRRHIGGNTSTDQDIYRREISEYLWKMGEDGELKCLNCENEDDFDDEDIDIDDVNGHIKIDEDGIDIDIKGEDGEEFKMKIDEDGVNIKTNNN